MLWNILELKPNLSESARTYRVPLSSAHALLTAPIPNGRRLTPDVRYLVRRGHTDPSQRSTGVKTDTVLPAASLGVVLRGTPPNIAPITVPVRSGCIGRGCAVVRRALGRGQGW